MDTIPHSSNRLNLECCSEFFAEILHMSINRAVIEILIVADDILHESISFDDDFTIFHEVFEEGEFRLGELEFYTIQSGNMRLGIEENISE